MWRTLSGEFLSEELRGQAIAKGYTGIVYGFKFPLLAEHVHYALLESGRTDAAVYLLNFHELSRSHRVNQVKAKRMPVLAYAEDYSLTIWNNLLPETIRRKASGFDLYALPAAVIWF